jgi:hypothetical protein
MSTIGHQDLELDGGPIIDAATMALSNGSYTVARTQHFINCNHTKHLNAVGLIVNVVSNSLAYIFVGEEVSPLPW